MMMDVLKGEEMFLDPRWNMMAIDRWIFFLFFSFGESQFDGRISYSRL